MDLEAAAIPSLSNSRWGNAPGARVQGDTGRAVTVQRTVCLTCMWGPSPGVARSSSTTETREKGEALREGPGEAARTP